jgi:C4-dicarboxylate transporter DctM subunit
MSPVMVGIIGFVILFILLGLGVPIGVSMALCGFLGFWFLTSLGAALSKLTFVPFEVVANYNYAVLPLFILMAEICSVSGISKDLFNLASKWLGRLPGGLAMATVGACAGFGAVSSSAIATAATIGLVAFPEMEEHQYSPALSTGAVAAGGTLGILIPPSAVFIVYGILTETSIGKLFIAGILPGILVTLFYIFSIFIICRRNPRLAPIGPRSSFREKIEALGGCVDVILLVILDLGGLLIGWFTPTEAGAIGAAGALTLTIIRKRMTWLNFKQAMVGTLKTTGMIYGVLIGAFILNYFVAVTTLPFVISNWVTKMDLPPLSIIIVIVLIYLVLGVFMDEAAMIVLTIPIFAPVVSSLGLNLIWFGVIVVRVVEIAMISPPLGVTMYVISGISKYPLETVYKGVIPFLASDLVSTAILIFFPMVSLWLPSLFF